MKIAMHVDQLSAKVPGGIGTYIRELVPALAELPETDLVLFHSKGEGHGIPAAWRTSHPVIELGKSSRALYPQWSLLARPPLPRELQACDIVHTPLPAAIPPSVPGKRLVVTVHDLAFDAFPESFPGRWRWLYQQGLKAALQRADEIITPSKATAHDVERRARRKGTRARITVIPEAASLESTGVDAVPVLERIGVPSPYILAVGTIEPRKNLETLIRAHRYLASQEGGASVSLVIAGPDGWRADQVHDFAARPGPGRVVFTGRLSASDLDAVYRRAWCCAYLSSFEGFGLPVLEAMARGIPVVASNTSSIPEVAGDAAILVDPTDVAGVAHALDAILGSETVAARLSAAGRERAAGFSWDEAARATREVYEG